MNTKKKGAQTASTAASQLLRPAAGFGSAFGAAPNPAQTLSQALNLHQRGDLTGAERLYRQVLRARAEDPNALNMLGVVKIQQGLAQEAVNLITKAVQAQPEFAEAHNNLGLALRKLGQLEQAVQSHERAIQIKPAYAEALNNLATALREAERLDEALAACDRALEIKPEFAQALNSRAATLSQAGRHAEALIDVERAITLAPRLAKAHFNHGVILVTWVDMTHRWWPTSAAWSWIPVTPLHGITGGTPCNRFTATKRRCTALPRHWLWSRTTWKC